MSDHYPVRQVVDIGAISDGYPATITATVERVFCGCTNDYRYDYGHKQEPT